MKTIIPCYTEHRTIDTNKVKDMCVQNRFYTRGDNKEYTKMFNMCKDYNKTNEQNILQNIAGNILDHSNEEDLNEYGFETIYEIIAWIMGMIIRDCTWIHYDSEEREIEL